MLVSRDYISLKSAGLSQLPLIVVRFICDKEKRKRNTNAIKMIKNKMKFSLKAYS